ncbi:unnamed protein product [marine sediment metagenome]|uniref:Uncharacterized protein n=1 Tax=marine sediment metagenome TaxID=412755 RepID=X1PNU3_9ZZZZ
MRTYTDCCGPTADQVATEVKIGTITLSAKAKKIIGLWAYAVGGAGVTALENVTGIVRLDSPDFSIAPMRFPLDCVASFAASSGAVVFAPRILPVDIPAVGNGKIDCFVTLDMALTIAATSRVGVIYEGE